MLKVYQIITSFAQDISKNWPIFGEFHYICQTTTYNTFIIIAKDYLFYKTVCMMHQSCYA